MSIRVMTSVWDCEDLQDSEMLVFLAMADWSDDAGKCWPSIAQIANKTRKGERTVQGVIKSLAAKGHLTRDEKPGKGCTYYLHPRSGCAPAPRKDRTPAVSAPPQRTADTPAAAAPNTPVHTNTSTVATQPTRTRASASAAFPKPDWADDQVWSDLLVNRKRKNLAPTATAHVKLLRDIDALVDPHWPPGRILEAAVSKGWGAIYPSIKDSSNGHRPANDRYSRPNRSSEIDDAARNLGFGG